VGHRTINSAPDRSPGSKEFKNHFFTVGLTFLENVSALGVKEGPVAIQEKKMRISDDFRILGKERFVTVLSTIVHFHDQESIRQLLSNRRVFSDEEVKTMAPPAPFTSDL